MARIQRREQRLLVIGGLVAAAVLGYLYVVEPLTERREQVQAELSIREARLQRQQRLVERRERYEQELEELRAEVERQRARLLPGDKAPLAASELQSLVKRTAQETGVEVRSERVLPTNDRAGYTEVPVEVTLSGPIRAIASFLHQLEAAPLLLAVQDVKLRVVSVGAPRELLATLAIAGYIATGAESAPRRNGPARRPGA